MWRWFSINLSDDVHFGGIRIGTEAGDLHRGWVWKDGRHSSVREWRVKSELADDGITHKVSHVTALDAEGREHELRADVLRVAGAPRRGTIVNEGLARWMGIEPRIAQQRTGHGSGLGRQRYVVEQTIAAVHQNRRLKIRYEKREDIHLAFLTLACVKLCWYRLDPKRG